MHMIDCPGVFKCSHSNRYTFSNLKNIPKLKPNNKIMHKVIKLSLAICCLVVKCNQSSKVITPFLSSSLHVDSNLQNMIWRESLSRKLLRKCWIFHNYKTSQSQNIRHTVTKVYWKHQSIIVPYKFIPSTNKELDQYHIWQPGNPFQTQPTTSCRSPIDRVRHIFYVNFYWLGDLSPLGSIGYSSRWGLLLLLRLRLRLRLGVRLLLRLRLGPGPLSGVGVRPLEPL